MEIYEITDKIRCGYGDSFGPTPVIKKLRKLFNG